MGMPALLIDLAENQLQLEGIEQYARTSLGELEVVSQDRIEAETRRLNAL